MVRCLFMMTAGLLLTTVGCASWGGPPADLLQRLPVVEVGKTEPVDKPFVLYIPKGRSIPMYLTVKGPLFVKPGEATAQVQLTQSLYIYKEWSSLDGKHWTHQAFEGGVSLGLAPKGGLVDVHVMRTD
ncbi:MAG TPA: hypothetical protein VH681_10470 [Nitrospiraceae bacterium]